MIYSVPFCFSSLDDFLILALEGFHFHVDSSLLFHYILDAHFFVWHFRNHLGLIL